MARLPPPSAPERMWYSPSATFVCAGAGSTNAVKIAIKTSRFNLKSPENFFQNSTGLRGGLLVLAVRLTLSVASASFGTTAMGGACAVFLRTCPAQRGDYARL